MEQDGEWAAAVGDSVGRILRCGVDSRSLCIETLDASFPLLGPVIERHGLSICLDVGHLFLYGLPFKEWLLLYLDKSAVVHLHGVKAGKDHCAIGTIDPGALELLFTMLQSDVTRTRVVTLEIFNEDDLNTSLNIMERSFAWAE